MSSICSAPCALHTHVHHRSPSHDSDWRAARASVNQSHRRGTRYRETKSLTLNKGGAVRYSLAFTLPVLSHGRKPQSQNPRRASQEHQTNLHSSWATVGEESRLRVCRNRSSQGHGPVVFPPPHLDLSPTKAQFFFCYEEDRQAVTIFPEQPLVDLKPVIKLTLHLFHLQTK